MNPIRSRRRTGAADTVTKVLLGAISVALVAQHETGFKSTRGGPAGPEGFAPAGGAGPAANGGPCGSYRRCTPKGKDQ